VVGILRKCSDEKHSATLLVWGGVILWILAKYRFRKLSIKLGYSIPINVFDYGLSLPHYGTIVVSLKARVGTNCRIHVGVNIGAHRDKAPRLGNNVYIGPGAIIFGGIEIADNVSIGANATVNKSITEPNTVVVGTPACIVKRDAPAWNNDKAIPERI
jgi:serine O-acetyltransferase